MRFHGWPLGGRDAVDGGIAQRTIGANLMSSQDPVELRAQALNSLSALHIEAVRTKLTRNAAQIVKRVAQ